LCAKDALGATLPRCPPCAPRPGAELGSGSSSTSSTQSRKKELWERFRPSTARKCVRSQQRFSSRRNGATRSSPTASAGRSAALPRRSAGGWPLPNPPPTSWSASSSSPIAS
ncbi:unnamed protein product, partial [Effrenium voratum]